MNRKQVATLVVGAVAVCATLLLSATRPKSPVISTYPLFSTGSAIVVEENTTPSGTIAVLVVIALTGIGIYALRSKRTA